MTKVAVVLSGCGHLDGAEIRESVLTLLYLDQQEADVTIFARDKEQAEVINHLTGEAMPETRNVLVESARIARGAIHPLAEADADLFDALILPGGYGVAKNLSNFATAGTDAKLEASLCSLFHGFLESKKPIGAICIAPAVLVASIRDVKPLVTIGEDRQTAEVIEAMGGVHQDCPSDDVVVDEKNLIVSCSAYMRDDRLSNIAKGIEKLVKQVLNMAKDSSEITL